LAGGPDHDIILGVAIVVSGAGWHLCHRRKGFARRPEKPTKTKEDVGEAYWRGLAQEQEFLDREHKMPIEKAFIELKVLSTEDHERALKEDDTLAALRNQGKEAKPVPFRQVFLLSQEAKRPWKGLLVQGDPGSGKTTGCQQVARLLAHRPEIAQSLGLPANTRPIFFKLRQLAVKENTAAEVRQAICREIARVAGQPDDAGAIPAADALLREHPALILILDGLDEVPSEEAMEAVARLCHDIESQGGVNRRLLVTARTELKAAEKFRFFQQFDHSVLVRATVQPFEPDQVRGFMETWFALHGEPALAAGLWTKVGQPMRADVTAKWMDLLVNPLMLNLTCQVYRRHPEKLPEDRLSLFAVFVRGTLERRTQIKDVAATYAVLQDLAWWMQCQATPAAQSRAQLEAALKPILAQREIAQAAHDYLSHLSEYSGVLVPTGGHIDGEPRRGFIHQQFREALAATWLRDKDGAAGTKELAEGLLNPVNGTTWRQVALMAVHGGAQPSQGFVSTFFTELTRVPFFENSDVVEWASEFMELSRDLRPAARAGLMSAWREGQMPVVRNTALLHFLRGGGEPELLAVARLWAKGQGLGSSPEEKRLRSKAREVHLLAEPEPMPDAPARGELWVEPRTRMVFVWVPPGKFRMGDQTVEVEITQGYWLARYPCTQADWAAVMGPDSQPSHFGGHPRRPVESVSWDDISGTGGFLAKFNALAPMPAGRKFTLPSEAQLEMAIRAGTRTVFYFGDDEGDLGRHAWFVQNSQGRTHEVGLKLPNGLGLYDMAGNVWEWVLDAYQNSLPGGTDPVFTGGSYRVLRGGSWGYYASGCRSADRGRDRPDFRRDSLGFRVAVSSTTAK